MRVKKARNWEVEQGQQVNKKKRKKQEYDQFCQAKIQWNNFCDCIKAAGRHVLRLSLKRQRPFEKVFVPISDNNDDDDAERENIKTE